MPHKIFICVLVLFGMGNILHATPDCSDGLYWGWDTPSALGIPAAKARKEIASFRHRDVKLQGDFPNYTIKLKSSDLTVGRIRYDAFNAEISIYTFLPHSIPEKRRNIIAAFFKVLNKDMEFSELLWGHYYINPDSGECGFVRRLTSVRQLHGNPLPREAASQKIEDHWGDCHLYELYPEITKARQGNVSVSQLLETVNAFPLHERKRGKLEEMQLYYIPRYSNGEEAKSGQKIENLSHDGKQPVEAVQEEKRPVKVEPASEENAR